ncbi:glycine-rich domain-containing protein-like, partial [Pseudomonas putida]|nr:glycine-rich domain-containing protein-like [Pseudomonas putida]
LVAAAKEQLNFLATVDRNRWLYEGRGLDKAIHRSYSCWLPLLAKHSKSPFFEGPLVVPLDCEWIWHCHRLNPVRYKTDCKKLYG